jgi:hypothetical protein
MGVFSLNNFKDLFEKSTFELQRLQNCRCHPDYDYLLFNITVSINHLFEWCIKDSSLDEQSKLECIKKFNPYERPNDVPGALKNLYNKIPNFPVVNEKQLLIRQLCNKAKHFKKVEIEKQSKNNISESGVMQSGDQLGAFHYRYHVEVQQNDVKLDDLLLEIRVEWESFINENGSV